VAMPKSREAKLFYCVAEQRFDDASFLLEVERNIAAVYLAGYGVECILKALILSSVAGKALKEMVNSFRGAKAHDFEWLKKQYRDRGGNIPKDVALELSRVESWTTDMRYRPGLMETSEAEAFLKSAKNIIDWAKGRM